MRKKKKKNVTEWESELFQSRDSPLTPLFWLNPWHPAPCLQEGFTPIRLSEGEIHDKILHQSGAIESKMIW